MKILKEDIDTKVTFEDAYRSFYELEKKYRELVEQAYYTCATLDEAGYRSISETLERMLIKGLLQDEVHSEIHDNYTEFINTKHEDIDESLKEASSEVGINALEKFHDESLTESTLQEKMWRYKLRAGLTLRAAIDDENYARIKDSLKKCWEEIHELIPQDFDEDDLENKSDEIDLLSETTNYGDVLDYADDIYDDEDEFIEEIEDDYNYQLNDLYDFCDDHAIWIPTSEEL